MGCWRSWWRSDPWPASEVAVADCKRLFQREQARSNCPMSEQLHRGCKRPAVRGSSCARCSSTLRPSCSGRVACSGRPIIAAHPRNRIAADQSLHEPDFDVEMRWLRDHFFLALLLNGIQQRQFSKPWTQVKPGNRKNAANPFSRFKRMTFNACGSDVSVCRIIHECDMAGLVCVFEPPSTTIQSPWHH